VAVGRDDPEAFANALVNHRIDETWRNFEMVRESLRVRLERNWHNLANKEFFLLFCMGNSTNEERGVLFAVAGKEGAP